MAARTARTEAKWYAEYQRATRGGARQEARDERRAQMYDEPIDLYYGDGDEYWELEVAIDY